jgi:tetratricopeptide (TPR) repeat protein
MTMDSEHHADLSAPLEPHLGIIAHPGSPIGTIENVDELEHFANEQEARFFHTHDIDVLITSATIRRQVLRMRPSKDAKRHKSLTALLDVLNHLAKTSGDPVIISETILLQREEVDNHPLGDPAHEDVRGNLASQLLAYFESTGLPDPLEESIDTFRQLLQQQEFGHPNRGMTCSNLATGLNARYALLGDVHDLDEALIYFQQSVDLHPSGHLNRGKSVNNIAVALATRFETKGNTSDLIQAIHYYREGISLCNPGSFDHISGSINLASALRQQADRTADIGALVEAVQILRAVLVSCPSTHPSHSRATAGLALSVAAHFEYTGDITFFHESISLLRDALTTLPRHHSDRQHRLTNLANALAKHAGLCGGPWDLHEALELHQEALGLCSINAPDRPGLLENCANTLDQFYDLQSTTQAINLYRESLRLRNEDDPARNRTLNNLGESLTSHFDLVAHAESLSEALRLQEESLLSSTPGHPDILVTHHLIARIFLKPSPLYSWKDTMKHLASANDLQGASAGKQLNLAVDSLQMVHRVLLEKHRDTKASPRYMTNALELHLQAIRFLPQVAHVGLDLSSRLDKLVRTDPLCRNGAMYAIALDRYATAIEILEEGKSFFWMQALRLRSRDLERLSVKERTELRDVFQMLEQDDRPQTNSRAHHHRVLIESWVEQRRWLDHRAKQMLKDIRSRPGFEFFLATPPFNELTSAVGGCTIIVLLSNELGSVALAIQGNGRAITRVDLPLLPLSVLQELAQNALSMFHLKSSKQSSNRLGMGKSLPRNAAVDSMESIVLGDIWRKIVHPIVIALSVQVISCSFCVVNSK